MSIDGKSVDDVPRLTLQLFTLRDGDRVTLGVLRGSQALTLSITAIERPHNFDRLMDFIDPDKDVIPRLGILGVDITEKTAQMLPALRLPSGVIVIGHTRVEADGTDTGLTTGDTIHSINGTSVASVDQIRTALAALKRQSPVVLQIERNGQLMFLALILLSFAVPGVFIRSTFHPDPLRLGGRTLSLPAVCESRSNQTGRLFDEPVTHMN